MSKKDTTIETTVITGIERYNNDLNSTEGSTQELINAQYKNDSIVPVFRYKHKHILEETGQPPYLYKGSKVHTVTNNESNLTEKYFFTYKAGTHSIRYGKLTNNPQITVTVYDLFTLEDDEVFKGITTLNNIVIINTSLKRTYLIYKDSSYIILPELKFPDLFFHKKLSLSATNSFYGDNFIDMLGGVTKMNSDNLEKNAISGYFFIRFAFKLFDGTYIKHSIPFLIDSFTLYNPEEPYSDNCFAHTGSFSYGSEWNARLSFFNIYYYYINNYKSLYEKWEGVIDSLDIFATKVQYPFSWPKSWTDFENNKFSYTTSTSSTYKPLSKKADPVFIKEDFEEQSTYHKVQSIPFDDLINNEKSSNWDETQQKFVFGWDPHAYAVSDEVILEFKNQTSKPFLPIDNYSWHTIYGLKELNYNSRIHYANLHTILSEGDCLLNRLSSPSYYDMSSFYPSYDLIYRYKIKTVNGNKAVIKSSNFTHVFPNDPDSPTGILLSKIISYPDSRAYKLIVTVKNTNTNIEYKAYEIELKPHKMLNIAFSYNEEDREILIPSLNADLIAMYPVYTPSNDNNTIIDVNRVQLSELDNPFVFPAENSYQIGSETDYIQDINITTQAISEGQFGMFPLYIFTKNGIWLLQQGGSGINYSNIVPVNRIVANEGSTISTKGAIFFLCIDGIYALQGREAVCVSRQLRNYDIDYTLQGEDYSSLMDGNYFEPYINSETFLNYINTEGSFLVYDSKRDEILITNNTKSYSYIYSLRHKNYYKIDTTYDSAINLEPSSLLIKNEYMYNIEERDSGGPYNKRRFFIQTNPLKFSSLWKKKINRLMLRCNILNKHYNTTQMVVMGSNNLYEWKRLNGIITNKENISNLEIKRLSSSYKYFVLIISGEANINDSYINLLQSEIIHTFTSRLR